jgi:hypothetical protein
MTTSSTSASRDGAPSGNLAGYHAITAPGYNSNRLVIENSWGTGWGNRGYGTLSWSFVNRYVFDAVSISPMRTGQPMNAIAPASRRRASGPGVDGHERELEPLPDLVRLPVAAREHRQPHLDPDHRRHGRRLPASADLGRPRACWSQPPMPAARVRPPRRGPDRSLRAPHQRHRAQRRLAPSRGRDADLHLRHVAPAGTSYTYQWQRSTDSGSTGRTSRARPARAT